MDEAGHERRAVAFEGTRRIAAGTLADVARAVKAAHDRGTLAPVLVFDAESSAPIEIDVRGTPEAVVARLSRDAHSCFRQVKPVSQSAALSQLSPDAPSRGVDVARIIENKIMILPSRYFR